MSRRALIDNASITAAQRLLGDIKVKNLYNIDGDIAAFENIVQAILLYDEIFYIDDYKPEFRISRRNKFPFITPLQISSVEYDTCLQTARDASEDILLKIRGHEVDQAEIRQFLDMLKVHLVFNWRQSQSIFYLTVNLLSDQSGVSVEEYSSLHAMIVSQLWGEAQGVFQADLIYRDRNGDALNPETSESHPYGIGSQVQSFAAALNWLALKTNLYSNVAAANGMGLVLHPIRHSFLANLLQKTYKIPSATYDTITRLLRDGIGGTVRAVTSASEPVLSELNLPMWTAYLVTKAVNPSDFFRVARDLRSDATFAEARARLSELEALSEERSAAKYVTEINKLNLELGKVSQRLMTRFGVAGRQSIPLAPVVNLALKAKSAGAIEIPEALGKIPKPRRLTGFSDQFGFRGIMRSVVSDLVSIERLGNLHDLITKDVKREANEKSPIKTERSLWLGRNSFWKQYK